MKKDRNLSVLALAAGMVFSFNVAYGQSKKEEPEKVKTEYKKSEAVDDQKHQAALANEKQPNSVLNTKAEYGLVTYKIQLGWNIEDAKAEAEYEGKLAKQPGVLKVDADHISNTVSITVKEEDEHNVRLSLFDIQE